MVVMAVNLRPSPEQTEELRSLAASEGRSMHAVILAAIDEYIARHTKRAVLDRVLDTQLPRFDDALRRLGE
jgi:predicted transcriptional regulator